MSVNLFNLLSDSLAPMTIVLLPIYLYLIMCPFQSPKLVDVAVSMLRRETLPADRDTHVI